MSVAPAPSASLRALEEALVRGGGSADEPAVLAALGEFVQGSAGPLSDPDYALLVRGADLAFTAGRYELAEPLYDLLAAQGQGGEGVLLRQVHVQILREDPEAALSLLARLDAPVAWSLNADRLRAIALLDLGRAREAVAVVRAVIARAPEDATFVRMFVRALESAEETARLEELGEAVAGLPEHERFEILVRAALASRDYPALARLYGEHPEEVTSDASGPLAVLIQELTNAEDNEAAERLITTIGISGASSPKLAVAALTHFLREGDWASAEQWLAAAEPLIAANAEPLLKLKQLQYFCFTLQLDEAETIASAWPTVGEMPTGAPAVVAALYGALGKWDDVIDLLSQCIAHSVPIDNEVLLEAVGLAARRAHRHDDVVSLLRNSAGAGDVPEGIELLLDRLAVEMALLASLGRLDGEDAARSSIAGSFFADRAATYKRLLAGADVAARVATPPTVVPSPMATESAGTILFCADRRYLVGTCVAVSSLLRHNPFARTGVRVAVVSSADALDLASEALASIGAVWGTAIDVLPSAELSAQASAAGLRTGWGCFTPGHGLSEAAYYRLFAVQKLLDDGVSGRALYLDSDICVAGGMEEFFSFDLRAAPLAARYELDLPSIRQAARKLGLAKETYFNSGVLLFDLEHGELPAALAQSIAVSTERPEMLTFLDQCALNVAFEGKIEPLPDRLNYYVRPKDELSGADPTVWHFLTHWKPWDPQYGSENCRVWDAELAALAEVLSGEVLRELLSIQFEAASAYVPGA